VTLVRVVFSTCLCEQSGRTALLCACANGRLDVAQWLVTSGGSDARSERINVRILCGVVVACARSGGVRGSRVVWRVREQTGHTALLLASAFGHVNVVQWLVTTAGSNARSERSNVSRLCRCRYELLDVIIRLELCRTVCGVCEQDGRTALLCACANGHLDVAQWLVTSGGSDARSERNNVRILRGAVVRSIWWCARQSCRLVCVCVREQTGRTALLLASTVGHVNVVQWLVTSVGIDVRSDSERDNVGRRCVVFL
jgi:ankyrin repeat protein